MVKLDKSAPTAGRFNLSKCIIVEFSFAERDLECIITCPADRVLRKEECDKMISPQADLRVGLIMVNLNPV